MMPQIRERIRGSVLGQAFGDALGAPFEFAPPDAVNWIEELCAFTGTTSPHGLWVSPAPKGTGTDDVRYNRLFIDLVVELGGRMPDDVELAAWLLENAGVSLVPGTAFGAPGHLRFSFATSMENLQICIARIKDAI